MSLEKIKQSILSQANQMSETAIFEAEKVRDEKLAKVKAQIEADKSERASWLETEKVGILERRMTLAKLESRIAVLDRKQALIDKAYTQAYEQLCNMPAKSYVAMYESLVCKYAESGDALVIGDEDKGVLLPAWCEAICSKCGITQASESFSGKGVKLSSELADKDLSLFGLLADTREGSEKKVIELLFGEE